MLLERVSETEWRAVEAGERLRTLGLVNSRTPVQLAVDRTRLDVLRLSCLPQAELYRAIDYDTMPPLEVRFLGTPVGIFLLDGRPDPIYAAARSLSGKPDEHSAIGFLRFFFEHSFGPGRGFRLLQEPADVIFTGVATMADHRRVAELVRPALAQPADNGGIRIDGVVGFRDALFAVLVDIESDWTVRVRAASRLADGLPIVARLLQH